MEFHRWKVKGQGENIGEHRHLVVDFVEIFAHRSVVSSISRRAGHITMLCPIYCTCWTHRNVVSSISRRAGHIAMLCPVYRDVLDTSQCCVQYIAGCLR